MPESLTDVLGLVTHGAFTFVLPFLVVISLLVFVHEFGHYWVARKCGVRVDTFSLGFGPELWGRVDKNGTRWKVCALPLGGYVQMFGDTDPASAGQGRVIKDPETGAERPMTQQELSVSFFNKSVGQRAAIVAAGPLINFLFAIVVLAGVYAFVGKPVTPPVVTAVIQGSAGETAGLQPGDRIVQMNDETMERFSDIQRFVAVNLDKPVAIVYERAGESKTVTATPERKTIKDRFGFKHQQGLLGVIGSNLALDPAAISNVNGENLETLDPAAKRQFIEGKLDQTLVVQTTKDTTGTGKALIISPKKADNAELLKEAPLMLSSPGSMDFVRMNPLQSVGEAVKETLYLCRATLESLGQIITGARSAQELGGLVRIGAVAGDAAAGGLISLIVFAAMLSINLGLINLFPIPMLDGGHLVFYGVEALARRPIPEQVQAWAFKLGFALLISLMLFANLNDIYQLVTK